MIEKCVPCTVTSTLCHYDRIVVGGLIKDKSGLKVLFLKRSQHEFMPNVWEVPSGGMEDGEDMFTALSREISEETGLRLVEVKEFISAVDYHAGEKHCIQLNFSVLCSGNISLSQEHSEFTWSSIDSFITHLDVFMLKTLGLR